MLRYSEASGIERRHRQILRGLPLRMTIVLMMTLAGPAHAGEPVLKQLAAIPLDNVKGRIDHLAIDAAGKRLFVAALGNNSVEVIDLAASKAIKHLTGMTEPQGVAYLPQAKTLVVASGGDGKVRFYDGETFALKSTADDLDDADNVRADEKRVYVGYGSGTLAFFEGEKRTGEVKLAGHPESFQLESAGPRIFVNVPAARKIEVVDREKKSVIAQWTVSEAEANFPMVLDEPHHRLLVACRKPARLLALDTESGKVVATADICSDADDLWLDAAAHRIYVSGGEGCISVIDQSDADHYTPLAKIPTAPGARTSFFDRATRRLYLAVPQRGGGGAQRAEVRVFQPSDPTR
jgi:hypothetical protein